MLSGSQPLALSAAKGKHLSNPRQDRWPLGFFAALSMTWESNFFMACRKKGPLACHAERERSIWSHQAGGVAHLGFFAALRMTCPGHFFMA
jgi:hypothetical protein